MARSKLIAATNLHNGRLKSYQIDAEIPLADDLTIDVAIFGNPDASKAVVISSGLHGVEGLFGSAVQLATIDRYLATQQLPGASSGCGRGQKVKKDERITPSATKTI